SLLQLPFCYPLSFHSTPLDLLLAAIIIYCRLGVPVRTYTSYGLVWSHVHPEFLLRAQLDTTHAEGGITAGHRGPSGRQTEGPRREHTLSWRHCRVHRFSFHGRHTVGFWAGNAGTPAFRKHRFNGRSDR